MKIVKNSSFQKVSAKTDSTIEFGVFVYIFQHRSKSIFDIFSKMISFCKKAPLICPQRPNFSKNESRKALNHVLTFQNAGARRVLSIDVLYVTIASICVELRPLYCSKRISVPTSYITCLDTSESLQTYIYIYIFENKKCFWFKGIVNRCENNN